MQDEKISSISVFLTQNTHKIKKNLLLSYLTFKYDLMPYFTSSSHHFSWKQAAVCPHTVWRVRFCILYPQLYNRSLIHFVSMETRWNCTDSASSHQGRPAASESALFIWVSSTFQKHALPLDVDVGCVLCNSVVDCWPVRGAFMWHAVKSFRVSACIL